jgi:hypothetical protein
MKRFLLLFTLLLIASLAAVGADTRLVDAAKARDRDWCTCCSSRRRPSETAADGTTALHWAAHWDDVEMAGLLLRSGANVQAANRYGVAPLVLACANGSDRMVDLLLSQSRSTRPWRRGDRVDDGLSHRQCAAVKLPDRRRRQGQCSGAGAGRPPPDVGRGGRAQPKRSGADCCRGRDQRTLQSRIHADVVCEFAKGGRNVRFLLKAGASPDEALPPPPRQSTGAGTRHHERTFRTRRATPRCRGGPEWRRRWVDRSPRHLECSETGSRQQRPRTTGIGSRIQPGTGAQAGRQRRECKSANDAHSKHRADQSQYKGSHALSAGCTHGRCRVDAPIGSIGRGPAHSYRG